MHQHARIARVRSTLLVSTTCSQRPQQQLSISGMSKFPVSGERTNVLKMQLSLLCRLRLGMNASFLLRVILPSPPANRGQPHTPVLDDKRPCVPCKFVGRDRIVRLSSPIVSLDFCLAQHSEIPPFLPRRPVFCMVDRGTLVGACDRLRQGSVRLLISFIVSDRWRVRVNLPEAIYIVPVPRRWIFL